MRVVFILLAFLIGVLGHAGWILDLASDEPRQRHPSQVPWKLVVLYGTTCAIPVALYSYLGDFMDARAFTIISSIAILFRCYAPSPTHAARGYTAPFSSDRAWMIMYVSFAFSMMMLNGYLITFAVNLDGTDRWRSSTKDIFRHYFTNICLIYHLESWIAPPISIPSSWTARALGIPSHSATFGRQNRFDLPMLDHIRLFLAERIVPFSPVVFFSAFMLAADYPSFSDPRIVSNFFTLLCFLPCISGAALFLGGSILQKALRKDTPPKKKAISLEEMF